MIDIIKTRFKEKILTEDLIFEDDDIEILGDKLKKEIDKRFKRSFFIREVDTGSCNACEVECNALLNPYYNLERFGISFVASPKFADALMITGALTRAMEYPLKNAFELTPNPKYIIAVGDCTKDGGVFKGSYAVKDGIANDIKVDLWIKGCPPEPKDIIKGLLEFLKKID